MYNNFQRLGRALLVVVFSGICLAGWGQNRFYKHTVQAGETLYGLATRYGVSIAQIKQSNKGMSGDTVRLGATVLIPVVAHSDGVAGTDCREMHKVQRKETIWGIAKQYGLTVEALLAANPDLASGKDKLKKGLFLCIPYATTDSIVTVNPVKGYGHLRIAVVLPLLGQTVEAARCVEFYRGFLMAVDQMKKRGTDITVSTFDEPKAAEGMAGVMDKVRAAQPQLLIGPLYPSHFSGTASDALVRGGLKWVVPFSSRLDKDDRTDNLFMLNAPEDDKARLVADLFLRTFSGAKVVVLHEPAGVANEKAFADLLRRYLSSGGMEIAELPAGYGTAQLKNALATGGRRTIFITDTSLKNGAAGVTAKLRQLRQEVAVARFSVLGYPEWMSTDSDGLSRTELCGADTYVFTSNYFNPYAQATRDFKSSYTGWFKADIENVTPRMAPLGYDAGLYMLMGLKAYGPDFSRQELSANYLQTPLRFVASVSGRGNINASMYFVHYGVNDIVNLISLK